jgi:phytoene dehydrogenase-like protein
MGAIPAQLAVRARAAGATIETGAEVETVVPEGEGARVDVDDENVEVDATVVATDPKSVSKLAGVAVPATGKGCVTQYVAIDDRDLDTGKRIILNAADPRPNQVAPMSAVAPEYAPDGRQLLAATFLGQKGADDEELAEEVRETLSSWYPEHRFDGFEHLHTERIPFAQFQQRPGFRDLMPSVDEPYGAVYLAGDYTRWSSIQGALDSGRRAAEAVLDSE